MSEPKQFLPSEQPVREYTVFAKGAFVPLHAVAKAVGGYLAGGGEIPLALAIFDVQSPAQPSGWTFSFGQPDKRGGAILDACRRLAAEADAEGATWGPALPAGAAGMLHLCVSVAQRLAEGAGLAVTAHVPEKGDLPGIFFTLTGSQILVENRTETSLVPLREVALDPAAEFRFAKWAAAAFDVPLQTAVFCYRS